MGVCERCTENGNCAWQNHDETICREKPAFPITNADRIRSMTDEELAEMMSPIGSGCPPAMRGGVDCSGQISCYRCWLDWLKQEAKE